MALALNSLPRKPSTHRSSLSQINNGNAILINFFATWCRPCKTISSEFESLSDAAPKGIEFYKVDVDEQDKIAKEVGITAMPTFILFKDGAKIADLIGAKSAELEILVTTAKDVLQE